MIIGIIKYLYRVKLAQVTNKCINEDLDFFVRECGDILGVSEKVNNKNDPKAIIRYVLEQLVIKIYFIDIV
jgi:intraflagellar transport protein 52